VILFDGAVLAAGPITGVGGSFLTTLAAYAAIAEQPCAVLLPPGADAAALPFPAIAAPRRRLARELLLPALLRRHRASLLHSPVAALPPRAPCPRIATIHDLPWCAPPGFADPGRSWWHRAAARRALRDADCVLVPSEATRRDCIAFGGAACAARLRVVPHGVAPPEAPAPGAALRGPFLVLGDRRPRKNLARVIAAHAAARAAAPGLPELLLVGPGQPRGYATEAEKLALLRGARALVHVALFEGYGLPVLEAFAHGVPVVTSDRGALAELAGDAALLVDPADVPAITGALLAIDRDDALRERLRARGLARARERTPAAAASAWLELHRSLLRDPGRGATLRGGR
jgi:glycosyltransferase involved in cell wall biosynthesis